MTGLISALSLVFMTVVLPLVIIMHYVTKWKATKGLTGEEQQMLEDLWESSERMLSRVNALETILDQNSPQWRDDEQA